MTPFRAPGEIPACWRCGRRLEPAGVLQDGKGRVVCAPCKGIVDGALQDRKALTIYLPLVLGFSLLLVFGALALVFWFLAGVSASMR